MGWVDLVLMYVCAISTGFALSLVIDSLTNR